MVALKPLPPDFARTRGGLHRVAELLVAPARKPDNEIALTATPGGFGTPVFEFEGARTRVRVEGTDLVLERDADAERADLVSIAAGAALLGPGLLSGGTPTDDEPLDLDPEAAERLAELYAFSAAVLERLRDGMAAADAASEINLWPEHFDIAFEAGPEASGLRANYGASPGDEAHPEPYLYVGPWTAEPAGPLWNATAFKGAELPYAALVAVPDPEAIAVEFMTGRRAALGP